jgi:phosphatidylserine/phosphatidylglycerophosphate/cardiolipin synthase-like enzyme
MSSASAQPAQTAMATRASARASDPASTPSGQLTLITEPQDGIAPVLSAVRGARHEVEMVMYEDDDRRVDSALVADAHRGVAVRVLLNGGYDGQGFAPDQAAYDYLQGRGVPVRWTASYFALTHQKSLIVDGRAYILTFNLTPEYYASSRDFGSSTRSPLTTRPWSRRLLLTGTAGGSPPPPAGTWCGARARRARWSG